jgi:hypothetical protein
MTDRGDGPREVLPPDNHWPLWRRVLDVATEHYQDHSARLRRWLDARWLGAIGAGRVLARRAARPGERH